jgi:hypothetical protein
MSVDDRARRVRMDDRQLYRLAGLIGVISGAFLAVDAVLDAVIGDHAALDAIGVAAPALGVLAITGIYLRQRSDGPCRHLDLGYGANVIGLIAVTAVSFARNFVLAPLDDTLAESIAESAPTLPAFLIAGVLAVVGIAAFGSALVRHGYDPVGAWLYTVALPLSGFGALLPVGVAAVIGLLAGAAVVRVSMVLRTRVSLTAV